MNTKEELEELLREIDKRLEEKPSISYSERMMSAGFMPHANLQYIQQYLEVNE